MIRRIAGVVGRPRATLAALVQAPTWLATWLFILGVWLACAGAFLSTGVGRQAVVDERVRVIETFGGAVTDAAYARLQEAPPWEAYLLSGSRTLLAPPATMVVALGLCLVARLDGVRATLSQGLAIAVHASVVLLLGQLVATPLHYIRESLTSPLNLAAILPLMEEGSAPARFFGTLDVFALWWTWLLALGLSLLTGRRLGRYLWPLAALYAGVAAILAIVILAMGGA